MRIFDKLKFDMFFPKSDIKQTIPNIENFMSHIVAITSDFCVSLHQIAERICLITEQEAEKV